MLKDVLVGNDVLILHLISDGDFFTRAFHFFKERNVLIHIFHTLNSYCDDVVLV